MEKSKKRLGAKLKELRGERTQEEIAKSLDVSLRTYQGMERGEVWPQNANFESIRKYFKLSPAELLGETDAEKEKEHVGLSVADLETIITNLDKIKPILATIRKHSITNKKASLVSFLLACVDDDDVPRVNKIIGAIVEGHAEEALRLRDSLLNKNNKAG